MDTQTGQIAALDIFQENFGHLTQEEFGRRFKEINVEALPSHARRQLERTGQTKIGRNSPCPCGSQKRFKRCCMNAATGA